MEIRDSKFARDMMAQKLMSENKDNPFNSRFFQPSDAYSKQQTRPIQGDLTLGNLASYFMPFSKDVGPYEDSPKLGRPGGVNIDFPPIAKDAVSGINKFGQVFRGELSQDEIKQLAFDTSMNVTGGSLVGSKLLKNAVPKDSLSMGLYSGTKAEKKAKIAALRKEANIERFGYDPNDSSSLPETSYRYQHQPRGPKDETPVRLDDLTKSTTGESAGYPDDFYTLQGQRIYAQGPKFPGDEFGSSNLESYNIIKNIRNKPNAEVTIYRAVPNDKSIKTINSGDFVSLSKQYAKSHAAGGYGEGGEEAGKILSKKVKVKDIYWDQNDVNEFGYFPESK